MHTSVQYELLYAHRTLLSTISLFLFAILIAGCSESAPVEVEMPPSETLPFQELYDQGVDRYLGLFVPTSQNDLGESGTVHTFATVDQPNGPMCFTGNDFTMSTREGVGSELLIFIEGGGGCGPNGCNAIDRTLPGIPKRGIMNTDDPENPVAHYNMAYVPYCDGSLFTGDAEVDSNGDGVDDRFFRGIHNLSASLDVIQTTFPAPSKILLAGNSAGGFGTHFALPLVRKVYPGVPIDQINDSGIGIYEPGTFDELIDYWNSSSFIPASCTTCVGVDGNLTDLHKYQLAEDDNLRLAYMSSKQDEVITGEFAVVSPTVFEEELLQAVSELIEAYPDRFRSLIADGDSHTFIQRQFTLEIGGTTVRQWVGHMVTGSEDWVSVTE